jgi:hypothetical protein
MKTELAISDHLVDANKTIPRSNSARKKDHFVGVNKMADCHPRAKGATTHQPRATPWELGHPTIHQP